MTNGWEMRPRGIYLKKNLQPDCQKKRAGWERVGCPGLGEAGNTVLPGLSLLAAEAGSHRSWGRVVGLGRGARPLLSAHEDICLFHSFLLAEAVGQDSRSSSPCPLPSQGQAWSHLWGNDKMHDQKCSDSLPTVPPNLQRCPPPPHWVLVCICRLIKPKPAHTVFPKHSLVTMNQ